METVRLDDKLLVELPIVTFAPAPAGADLVPAIPVVTQELVDGLGQFSIRYTAGHRISLFDRPAHAQQKCDKRLFMFSFPHPVKVGPTLHLSSENDSIHTL
jgi:hypothetical protein